MLNCQKTGSSVLTPQGLCFHMLLERGADPVGGPGDQNSGRCPFVAAVLKPHPNQIQNLQVPQWPGKFWILGGGNSHIFFNFHPDF